MPRQGHAGRRRLAKQLTAPHQDIFTDHLAQHRPQTRVGAKAQKIRMLFALNRFGRPTRQMRTDQLFRTMIGIGGQDRVDGVMHVGDGGIGKAPSRHHIALAPVELDFGGGETGLFAGGP